MKLSLYKLSLKLKSNYKKYGMVLVQKTKPYVKSVYNIIFLSMLSRSPSLLLNQYHLCAVFVRYSQCSRQTRGKREFEWNCKRFKEGREERKLFFKHHQTVDPPRKSNPGCQGTVWVSIY